MRGGVRAAWGCRAVVLVVALCACLVAAGRAEAKPDVLKPLPWDKATKVIQFGNHPVFKISLADGDVVVKLQGALESAKEVYLGRLVAAVLKRADTAANRLLA